VKGLAKRGMKTTVVRLSQMHDPRKQLGRTSAGSATF